MQHEVQVVALGDARVGVEVAVRIVRARSEGETQAIDAADGQRARAADRRFHAACLELIVVSEAGLEPGGVDFDGEIAPPVRYEAPGLTDLLHARIAGDRPADSQRLGRIDGRDARPQNHAVALRIAAGDAMSEREGRLVVACER